MELDKIAASIRSARMRAGLTQKEVAVALNKGQTTVASWETGRSQPDAITIIALSELFHVSSDFLLGISNFQDQNSEKFFNALTGEHTNELSNWSQQKLSQFSSELLNFYTLTKEVDEELLPLAFDTLVSILRSLQNLIKSYSKYERIYHLRCASADFLKHFNSLSKEEQEKRLSTSSALSEALKLFPDFLDNVTTDNFADEAISIIDSLQNDVARLSLFLISSLSSDTTAINNQVEPESN